MVWDDDETIEEKENIARCLAEELSSEEDDESVPAEAIDDGDEEQSERKQLKRDLDAEALKRLEDQRTTG